jgi:DNA repair photolyase
MWDAARDEDADFLIGKVSVKFSRVFGDARFDGRQRRAIYRYLFARGPQKVPPSLRSRVLCLYDPLADRSTRFPDGLRWCTNVYVGCAHGCGYCYVNGYLKEEVGGAPHPKLAFREGFLRDLSDLEGLGVPAAPLHLSNSTDPLQSRLETEHGDCLFALREVARRRSRFTSLTVLTKNPKLLCEAPYRELISAAAFQPFTVQVSCAFWRDEPRAFYEPDAPSVADRLAAIERLAKAGVAVELRVDPLFPATGIDPAVRRHGSLATYGLPKAQTRDDLEALAHFANSAGVQALVAKPLKVVVRGHGARAKGWFGRLYADAGGGQRTMRGGSWRLPESYQKALLARLQEASDGYGVPVRHCVHDVLQRA